MASRSPLRVEIAIESLYPFRKWNALTPPVEMPESSVAELAREANSAPDEALMDLSVTLAHRIRSLVASIEGYTDLLADTLGTVEQRELALRILEGAVRIERILADLQLFGTPIEPVIIPLPVTEVIAEIERFLDDEEANLFRVEMETGENHAILADPALLNQALLILTRNAFEAAKNGSRVLLKARCSEAPDYFCFDVWNEGAMPDDVSVRAFVPFYTTKAQNLGIGLPVAQRIAEAHSGTLNLVSNSKEGGTCFSLNVPLCADGFASILHL